MKIKNRITDKWSLECKDDYQSIREKVSFNEHSVSKNRIVFKSVMFSMASLIVVFLLVLPLLSNLPVFKNVGGNAAGGAMGNDAPNACPPNFDEGVDDDLQSGGSSKPDNVSPSPGAPGDASGGESNHDEYELFIQGLDQEYINDSCIEYIDYRDPDNKVLTITDFSKAIEYLNSLELSIYADDKVLNADHMLVINSGWATIIFDESCYLAISYENKYVTYSTNEDNILESILEYLK